MNAVYRDTVDREAAPEKINLIKIKLHAKIEKIWEILETSK